MTASYWVMPRDPALNPRHVLGMTVDQASRRWRVENYPATQFHTREAAEEYAVLCRCAGLEVRIVPSAEVLDEQAYQEYRQQS